MITVTLGRTGLKANKNGFGALPIQRVDLPEAVHLLRKALDCGVNFFDTARSYTDSETKLGKALSGRRAELILASKTPSATVEGFWNDLETSLQELQTDVIDIYQFHNPGFCPLPGDGTGLYEAMVKAREKGMIRFIGITNHRLDLAQKAVESELYDTLQFPFSYLSGEAEMALVRLCDEKNVGFIAMKALAGGLITSGAIAYQAMLAFPNAVPIWGIQKESELDEFIACQNGFVPTNVAETIKRDKQLLHGNFCRGCGYCMPCPAGIEINMCARMSLLIRRAPSAGLLSDSGQARMQKIEGCLDCGICRKKCPYGIDTPALLRENLADYQALLAGKPL